MNTIEQEPTDDEFRAAAEALGYFDAEDFDPDDLNDTNDWEFEP